MRPSEFAVFINCPFDEGYKPTFNAIVFSAIYCGFRPRCALEFDDGSEVRIDKIFRIVGECRLGVHDISRTELDRATGLPRFNMPLELGIFLGAKRFGPAAQKAKACLILDRERFRFQAFISDIAGQDVQAHHGEPDKAIAIVRDWLRTCSGRKDIPGGSFVRTEYRRFDAALDALAAGLRMQRDELTFNDFTNLVAEWLKGEFRG